MNTNINFERLEPLFSAFLENGKVDIETINNLGLSEQYIEKLKKNNVIKPLEDGTYIIGRTDYLYQYGRYLIRKKRFQEATKCFKKGYEINPNYEDNSYQLLIRSIEEEDFKLSFNLIKELMNTTNNKYYISDFNYFLYLLSFVSVLPEEYQEKVKSFSYEDIKVEEDDVRYPDIEEKNKIRSIVFEKNFTEALDIFGEVTSVRKKTIWDIIERDLLHQVTKVNHRINQQILKYVRHEQYSDLLKYLKDLEFKNYLNRNKKYILQLLETLINLTEDSPLPVIGVKETNSLGEALDGSNYFLALEICTKIKKGTRSQSIQSMHRLLSKIVIKINANLLISINSSLLRRDYKRVFSDLETCLQNLKKLELEPLLLNLTEECLEENNISKLMAELLFISMNLDSKICELIGTDKLEEMLYSFYNNIIHGNFMIARNILVEISNLSSREEFVKSLEVLKTYLAFMEKIQKKENNFYELEENPENYRLSSEVLSRIDNLKQAFLVERDADYSRKEIIEILILVITYSSSGYFSIIQNNYREVDFDLDSELKKFLKCISNEDILVSYDLYQNLNRTSNTLIKKKDSN